MEASVHIGNHQQLLLSESCVPSMCFKLDHYTSIYPLSRINQIR